ncbi:hypothetical protein QYF61_000111 [Mycteria americana]|uniref:Reverse transcriptase domain-containing protein n=1 Tax=Mycteria americana TaxID=33587 RepID=A0AAN7NJI1_MYCAM|nr:hypothetical protein QYF61_000111 [Mycteria americana]
MGPNGMHPWLLRELAGVIVSPLLIIRESPWYRLGKIQSASSVRGGRTSEAGSFWDGAIIPQGNPANYKLFSFTSVPWKVMQQIIVRTISKHMKNKKGNVSSDHGFTKGKSCLNNLKAFYNEVTALVDKGRYCLSDVSKAFNTVCLNILIDILMEYELDKWIGRWTENWLNCWDERAVMSSMKPGCRPVTTSVLNTGANTVYHRH